jgi:outer membrane protein insertion porin family
MLKIKNFLVLTFIILNFTIFNAYSEIVKKVEVKGNQRISIETIVIFGDIEIGKNYDSADVNLLIKKLFETTFFSDISVNLENNKMFITVAENPIIQNIVFDGEKAVKYKEAITELLSLRENASFVKTNIKNDITLIKKGDKAKISKVNFLGDKKVRESKLRNVVTSQESRFWKFISRSVYLDKARIELDKRLLKNYYRDRGYYEVDIKSTNVEHSDGLGFILTYNIDAGKRYTFKKIYADVAKSLDKEAFLSLESEFNKLIGKYYSQRRLKLVLDKIDKLSEQKELQFINHNILETLDGNGVEVKINIFEGEKVIIERINIAGNSVTNDSVIRSELIVDEGDPFSELLVSKSINEIKARNIFGEVSYKVLPGSSPDLKVLEISVEEKATGEVMAGAGVGTDGTSFQFAVKENNWLGRGVKLESALNVSQDKISGNILVVNPNYNFSGNEVSSNLDVSSTDRSDTSGFKSSKTGFELGTNFEQYEDIFVYPKISLAFEEIETDSTASAAIKKMEGNFFNSDLAYAVSLDKRNQTFKPTRGYKATFRQSLPLIQDSSAIMNGVDFSKYHDFSDDLIGAIKVHAKAINGIDGDVRLTNRLYIPQTRLRGFNTYKVGPKDGNDYIGGNYTTTFGAEAQLPNLLPESYKTDISFFMDTGNIWGVDYSDAVNETNQIRSSIGLSANVYTIIGPLSFTLAESLSKSKDDETQSFNFRLGTSF